MKQDHIFVSLIIYSDTLTSNDISKQIGMLYDKCMVKGEPKPAPSRILAKINMWEIGEDKYYPYDKEYDNVEGLHAETNLEELTDIVLARFDSAVIKKIGGLVEEGLITAKFLCACYCYMQPTLIFSKESVEKIQQLGAEIDIDYYHMPNEDSV